MPTENERFASAFTQCLMLWAQIENQICALFVTLTNLHPLTAQAIFYSAGSFSGRHAMTNAVVSTRKFDDTDYQAFIVFLLLQSDNYSNSRNQLSSSDIIQMRQKESKYYGQTIIKKHQQDWLTDPIDEQVIDISKLNNLAINYSALLALLIYANFDGPKDMQIDFYKSLEMARRLPKSAQSLPEDPILRDYVKPLLNTLRVQR